MPGVIRKSGNGAVQLSPNFYLSELVESDKAVRLGIDNTPDPMSVQNLFKLATLLESVRKVLGDKAILVSSGYRCPALNHAVGGAAVSDHLRGAAADFTVPSFGTPLQIATAIAKSNIKFGQLIWEGTWVHISLPDGNNDGEVLTAKFVRQPDGSMKTVYFKGLA